MNVLRLYTGDDGESHFEECDLPMETGPRGKISAARKAKRVIFLELNGYYDYHNAPHRQYVIFLDGAVEIEVAGGAKRTIQPGEILLAEDTTGHGHITRSLDGAPRRAVFIVLE